MNVNKIALPPPPSQKYDVLGRLGDERSVAPSLNVGLCHEVATRFVHRTAGPLRGMIKGSTTDAVHQEYAALAGVSLVTVRRVPHSGVSRARFVVS